MRISLVEVVARHLEHAAAVEEVAGHRSHRRVLHAADALLDVQHQDLVQLRHALGRPVVAAHQRLGRQLPATRLLAETLGDVGLQVEHQPVLAPPGNLVQPHADEPQQALVAMQLPHLEATDQPVRGKLCPALAVAGSTCDPDHHLQIAQAAGAFLAIRLERVGRVLVLQVPLAHLAHLGGEKGLGIDCRCTGRSKCRIRALQPAEEARFEQRGLHRDVAAALLEALLHGAHARADLQAGVPAAGDEALRGTLDGCATTRAVAVERGKQHQHIDVRVRIKLAAAIAADCGERRVGRHAGVQPEIGQGAVDEPGEITDQPCCRSSARACRVEARQKRRLFFPEARAQDGRLPAWQVIVGDRTRRHGRRIRRSHRVQVVAKAGAGGLPGETVRTS